MSTRDTNTVTIPGSDYIYTAQDSIPSGGLLTTMANPKHGCRFIVGDEIKYDQDTDTRSPYALDADGKECELDIVRQERRR